MYSFDVFDTIITRKTLHPQGVFLLIREKLATMSDTHGISKEMIDDFASLRKGAEMMARMTYQKDGIEDVTLDQIYHMLSHRGEINSDQLSFLKSVELDLEYECVEPVVENINRINELLDLGNKIVLISDMYLDSNAIRKMIRKFDERISELPLYVSSECKKTKATGNLFWYVNEKENCNLNDWVHIGDNIYSDVRMPEEIGIRTERYCYADLLPIEKKLQAKVGDSCTFQLKAGAARNVRLLSAKNYVTQIGASILGPVLFDYVKWVLEESVKQNIKQLFFIARDGFSLKLMADTILEHCDYDVKTTYIYGSRLAWRYASYTKENWDVERFIKYSFFNYVNSMPELAEACNVDIKILESFLRENFGIDSYDKKPIMRAIRSDKFRDFIICSHKEERANAIGYLNNAINRKEKYAFVELVGSGYTQECLAELMTSSCAEPINTFYYLMGILEENSKSKCMCFLPGRKHWYTCLEGINRAPHGQTIGYKDNKGTYEPLVDDTEDELIRAHHIEDLMEGVRLFADEFAKYNQIYEYVRADLAVVDSYMGYIYSEPDPQLLDYIGDIPFGRTGRKKEFATFAPKLTNKDIIRIFLVGIGNKTGEYYKGTSLDHSIMRCTPFQQRLIDFCKINNTKLIGYLYRKIIGGGYVSNVKYQVPYDLLKKRVAIYAAGNVGKAYYDQLIHNKKYKVVIWVDKKWKILSDAGFPVEPVERLKTTEFDTLLIAIESDKIALSIKQELIEKNIPEEKIVI